MSASRREAAPPARRSGFSLTASGDRVRLRPLRPADRRAMSGWIEEAAMDDPADRLAITHEGRPIGLLAYRMGDPEDAWLRFERVEVEPGLSARGFALEAVRLLEGEAVRRGWARRFWVAVPRSDGLALYFWLRLGYRPAGPGEAPWAGGTASDMMTMLREQER